MKTPFPGIDPYLEDQGLWTEFHSKFINAWQESLLAILPENYEARLDERVYLVHDQIRDGKLIIPDVAVEQTDVSGSYFATEASETGAETTTLTLPLMYEATESFIEIIRYPERTLVAILELLSPTNKGREYSTYLKKRAEVLASSLHLVEVDLLLRGKRMPTDGELPPAHFFALIARGDRRPKADVIYWTIRNRLPRIPIPLVEPDRHVMIDLHEVFETAFSRGAYHRAIDYDKPLSLPLAQVDLDWAREQVARSKSQSES